MAWPTGTLSITLEDVDRRASAVKQYATQSRDRMAAGNVPSTLIFDLFIRLKNDRAALASAATVPGIANYAQAQKGDTQFDVAAEFNNLLATIDGVTAWISANFPKDSNGYLLAQTWGAEGPVDRQFSSATTAGLRSVLDTLIATIN